MRALTADGRGLPEDLGDGRVHLDHEVLLLGHLGVALVDLFLDPFAELLFKDRGADVADPLLRRLRQLDLRLREVLVDLRVLLVQELPDLLDAEALVPA